MIGASKFRWVRVKHPPQGDDTDCLLLTLRYKTDRIGERIVKGSFMEGKFYAIGGIYPTEEVVFWTRLRIPKSP
jgi:hypothetical protein